MSITQRNWRTKPVFSDWAPFCDCICASLNVLGRSMSGCYFDIYLMNSIKYNLGGWQSIHLPKKANVEHETWPIRQSAEQSRSKLKYKMENESYKLFNRILICSVFVLLLIDCHVRLTKRRNTRYNEKRWGVHVIPIDRKCTTIGFRTIPM